MLRPNKALKKLLKLIAVYGILPFFLGLLLIANIPLAGKVIFFMVVLFFIFGIDEEYKDQGYAHLSPYKFYMSGWLCCLVGNIIGVFLL